MKLKEFHNLITQTVKSSKKTNPDITFFVNEREVEIESIGQFAVVPDVHIEFKFIEEEMIDDK